MEPGNWGISRNLQPPASVKATPMAGPGSLPPASRPSRWRAWAPWRAFSTFWYTFGDSDVHFLYSCLHSSVFGSKI